MSIRNIIDTCRYVAPGFAARLSSQRVKNIIVQNNWHPSIRLGRSHIVLLFTARLFSLIWLECLALSEGSMWRSAEHQDELVERMEEMRQPTIRHCLLLIVHLASGKIPLADRCQTLARRPKLAHSVILNGPRGETKSLLEPARCSYPAVGVWCLCFSRSVSAWLVTQEASHSVAGWSALTWLV